MYGLFDDDDEDEADRHRDSMDVIHEEARYLGSLSDGLPMNAEPMAMPEDEPGAA